MKKTICYQYYRLTPNKSFSNFKIDTEYELKIINPGFINVHAALWTIFSMGKFKEYQLYNSQEMVAYAQVIPKIFIFSFMGKNSLHIGPCWTHPDFRGKGLCPYLIRKIIEDYKNKDRTFYIFTSRDNISSQRSIEKVNGGGGIFAYGYKTRLGVYKISKIVK